MDIVNRCANSPEILPYIRPKIVTAVLRVNSTKKWGLDPLVFCWRILRFDFSPLRGSFFLVFCDWLSGRWPLNQSQNTTI